MRGLNCRLADLCLLLSALLMLGCGATAQQETQVNLDVHSVPVPNFPELSDRLPSMEGIDAFKVDFGANEPGRNSRLIVCVPNDPQGDGERKPCVFMAASGGTNFSGVRFEEMRIGECLPYALAGFIVVMYEVDGHMDSGDISQKQFRSRFAQFCDSKAGLVNARNAIKFALAKIPGIDNERLFAVGHSSAGRQAMLLGATDPRIKGCLGLAPLLSRDAKDEELLMKDLMFKPSNFEEALDVFAPVTHVSMMKASVLIAHGKLDRIIPSYNSENFVKQLSKHSEEVGLALFDTDHFQIPREAMVTGLKWLRDQAEITDPPAPLHKSINNEIARPYTTTELLEWLAELGAMTQKSFWHQQIMSAICGGIRPNQSPTLSMRQNRRCYCWREIVAV